MAELLSGLCVVAVAALVGAEWMGHGSARAVAKTTASAAFVAVGLSLGLAERGPIGLWVLLALIGGAAGDLFLLSREKRFFLAGLGSFLAAHVAYAVAFALLGLDLPTVAVAVLPLALVAAGVWQWLSDHVGSMGRPVLAYIIVICVMVALAAGVAAFRRDAAGLTLLAGAVAFFLSDLAVARERFHTRDRRNKVVGLPLYYLGQLMLAWGAAAALP